MNGRKLSVLLFLSVIVLEWLADQSSLDYEGFCGRTQIFTFSFVSPLEGRESKFLINCFSILNNCLEPAQKSFHFDLFLVIGHARTKPK